VQQAGVADGKRASMPARSWSALKTDAATTDVPVFSSMTVDSPHASNRRAAASASIEVPSHGRRVEGGRGIARGERGRGVESRELPATFYRMFICRGHYVHTCPSLWTKRPASRTRSSPAGRSVPRPILIFDFDGTVALGDGPVRAYARAVATEAGLSPSFVDEIATGLADGDDAIDAYDLVRVRAVAAGAAPSTSRAATPPAAHSSRPTTLPFSPPRASPPSSRRSTRSASWSPTRPACAFRRR
jgi:hypothetical protein